MSDQKQRIAAYWRKHKLLLACLLVVWWLVPYAGGILFVDELDHIRMGGFKLGFWIAQQGSIYVFIVLIFVYMVVMNRLDKAHGVQEE